MKLVLTAYLLVVIKISFCQDAGIDFSLSASPVIFAPGFISDGFDNRDMTISPTGDELFFTIQHKTFSVIMTCKKNGTKWSKPEVAPFSGTFKDLEAAFSPDGNRIYFSSNRSGHDSSSKKDYDIWYVERSRNGWSKPVHLDTTINTEKDEYYPSVARNGNLYFTRDNGGTKEDIFLAACKNGVHQRAVALPTINSAGYDFNAFIDPDEEFILFTSYKRADDSGGGDLYISWKKEGQWLPAKNLGAGINSSSIDYCPFVSFDKKYFFFTSKKSRTEKPPQKMNASDIKKILSSPGNGSDDIYIMDFDVIKKNFQ